MLSKKKILYVVNVDWFFISHRLPLALEALRLNHEVYLITKDTGRFEEMEKIGIKCLEVHFERSGKNPFKELSVILKLTKLYSQLKPDIIHHITLKPSIYGTISAWRCNCRAIIINAISGLGYTFIGNRRSLSKVILISLMKFAFFVRSTKFIFQNPDDQNLYRQLGFLNDHNHIIIKGSGVEENDFISKKSPSADRKVRVVLLARMLKDKGIFEFVRAANLLRGKYSDVIEFNLVGGIDIFNPAAITEEILKELCDGNYISWLGHKNNVKEIYEQADIVCLPSYREGLPKSLVEAMACSCPIITTDTIGCRECVEDGVNGYLVPVGDHVILAERIETLFHNEDLRIKMGYNSRRKMVDEMSLSKVVQMTFNFYE